jgi:hypothetical protein
MTKRDKTIAIVALIVIVILFLIVGCSGLVELLGQIGGLWIAQRLL